MVIENKLQIRRLKDEHVLKPFDCGDDDLNEFFLKDANSYFLRDAKPHDNRLTWVFVAFFLFQLNEFQSYN